MLIEWNNHCYKGPCQFDRTGDVFTIQTDAPDARGSWFAFFVETVIQGEKLVFNGQATAGEMLALFFYEQDYVDFVEVTEGQVIVIPENVNRIRVDLRLWNQQGEAKFRGISLEPCQTPDPPEMEGLPIPPPDTTQKHHVSGWKWGRNIAIMVHGDDDDVPTDYSDEVPYQVTGFQHGRRLDLDIGFPIGDFPYMPYDPDEDNQE